MDIELNLFFLALFGVVFASMTPADPTTAMRDARARGDLMALEDAAALHPEQPEPLVALAGRYLELGRPELAVAAIGASDARTRRHPMVGHRLAQAYERSGRLDDALSTARVAEARCARSLGSSSIASTTPIPTSTCQARQEVVLTQHLAALGHMKQWGVRDPRTDPRASLAHELSQHRARVALR